MGLTVLYAVAGGFSALAGFLLAKAYLDKAQRDRLRAASRGRSEEAGVALESGGVAGAVIRLARRESVRARAGSRTARRVRRRATTVRLDQGLDELVLKAGLSGAVTREGCAAARRKTAGIGALAGACAALAVLPELGALLAVVGALAGVRSVRWALRREADARAARLEAQLSEMAEVVSLGLRSGLSFDRAFEMYAQHFSTGLARSCEQAFRSWSHGLVSRDEALRELAASYDSPPFARLVEGVIRSLRFGSSLAEGLEASAAEVRSVHRANVEERVAKAPVKMLVPVGMLILPAMLVLVLGPVMIELVNGM